MMRTRTVGRRLMVISFAGLLAFLGAREAELMGYVTTGASWNAPTASYRINPNFTDPAAGTAAQQIAAIQAAANEWGLTGGSNFSFSYQGTSSSTAVAPNGVNTIFYSHEDGNGALAVCYWWSVGGTTTDFDIRFFDRDGSFDFIWSVAPNWNEFDIESVACHELGHALGLAHSPVVGATMFASVAPGTTSLRSLHVDDIAGIQSLYGQAPPPLPTITGVTPARGWVGGGTPVTVTGSDFAPGAITVLFDGLAAGNVNVVNPTMLTCTLPPGQGQHQVDVTVLSGSHAATLQEGFTYDTLRSLVGYGLPHGWNAMEIMVPEDFGKFYRAVLSTSPGNTPMSLGDPTDSRMFPLTWSETLHWSLYDDYYHLPYWFDTTGYLDATGGAIFHVWGLDDPQYAGIELHVCFFVTDLSAPSRMSTISNPITVAYQ